MALRFPITAMTGVPKHAPGVAHFGVEVTAITCDHGDCCGLLPMA